MFGLGKPRSELGRFIDKNNLTQEAVRLKAGVGRDIMSELCGNKNYQPQEKTMVKIVGALRSMGYDVSIDDFWT